MITGKKINRKSAYNKQKMAIYQIAISYKVLPHAYNVKDFFKKSKFFNTFYKMSITCRKVQNLIKIL